MAGTAQLEAPGGTAVAEPTSTAAPVRPDDPRAALAARLGHDFADPALLELACTHRSWCAEHAGTASNERLEFLGDSVLSVVVTSELYSTYPDLPEGELAKVRAAVVSMTTLAELAAEVHLGEALRLGKGEAASGGRDKPSILADAFEAVLGALYVDGGLEAARPLVLRLVGARLAEAVASGPGGHDHKTQLQELVARRFDETPEYRVRDEGPDHDKRFFAVVLAGGEVRGEGEGRTKKQAEQEAARVAWDRLTSGEDAGDARAT